MNIITKILSEFLKTILAFFLGREYQRNKELKRDAENRRKVAVRWASRPRTKSDIVNELHKRK